MQKKLFYFFVLMSICTTTFAQKSNMIFFSQNEEKFYLVVNGVTQNERPTSNVKISGMAAPMQYSVRIKFEKNNTIINDKVTLLPNIEKTWVIQPKNGNYVIKYSGSIDLTPDLVQNPEKDERQEEVVYHTQANTNNGGEGFSFNMNTGEENVNISASSSGMNANINTKNSSGRNYSEDRGYDRNEIDLYSNQKNDRRHNSAGCNNPISNIDFKSELARVSSQTTAAGKKIVAEKITKTYCLTAKQTYALCNQLLFSNDKMEIAKYCYSHCYDPENYEEVYKCFPLSASVKELDDYISRLGYQAHQPQHQPQHYPNHPQMQEEEYVPGYSGPKGCSRPMSGSNFNDAKATIAQASFENTKLSTAKTIIAANCLTTNQIIEICKLFDFENTKLDFAKIAYSKTYDKANYYKVNVVFDFDASKETLNRFIQNGGR